MTWEYTPSDLVLTDEQWALVMSIKGFAFMIMRKVIRPHPRNDFEELYSALCLPKAIECVRYWKKANGKFTTYYGCALKRELYRFIAEVKYWKRERRREVSWSRLFRSEEARHYFFEDYLGHEDRSECLGEMQEALCWGVHQLPSHYRDVLLDRFEGKSFEEISEARGTSVDSVRISLYRARKRIRKCLMKWSG